jgi:hypothetical protein
MIEDLEEEAMSDPSGENINDSMSSYGWLCRVISHTPVIASKIWTPILEILLAMNLPFGENATKFADPDTCIVRIHASHEDPTPPMTCASVVNSDMYRCRGWDFVGRDGKAEW